MNTWLHHTQDGGITFEKTGEKSKHVDNHALWIDPEFTDHWLIGTDGGIYETWNAANFIETEVKLAASLQQVLEGH